MIAKISFQNSLKNIAFFLVEKLDFPAKNPVFLKVKIINYSKTFIFPCICEFFSEKTRNKEILLPLWIKTHLLNKNKDFEGLFAKITPVLDEKIENPLEIQMKITDVFYKNERIHKKSLFFSFIKLPELVFIGFFPIKRLF